MIIKLRKQHYLIFEQILECEINGILKANFVYHPEMFDFPICLN